MNSFQLKVLACLFMLIDHIGVMIFPPNTLMRIIGRLAYPLFAWQIVIGYQKTKDLKAYIKRLFIFAVISQVPYMIAINKPSLNIFFTLIMGLTLLQIVKTFKNPHKMILSSIYILICSELFKVEYGWYGVLVILIFYIFNNYMAKSLMFASATAVYSIANTLILQPFAIISLLILKLYNNERGLKAKYLFYIFYPAHLIILSLLKLLL